MPRTVATKVPGSELVEQQQARPSGAGLPEESRIPVTIDVAAVGGLVDRRGTACRCAIEPDLQWWEGEVHPVEILECLKATSTRYSGVVQCQDEKPMDLPFLGCNLRIIARSQKVPMRSLLR